MKTCLKPTLLLVLATCGDQPVPEAALVSLVRRHDQHRQPTLADVLDALHAVEAGGYAVGVTDDLTGERSWTLTTKGTHKARGLR
jgi:hypothetical protein